MSQINESAIRTPGVYTTEIPTLPPSVAQVSTAIPAFIGYTQKAEELVEDDLRLVPKKIFSLKEYEQYFGFADGETGISVNIRINLDTGARTGIATINNPSVHNLYYSLRLYFDNGGGPCYIISIGATTIGATTSALVPNDFIAGLNVLAASDEPTIIVFSEGQSLGQSAYYNTVISQAIEQCRVLQDRFTLVDIHPGDDVPPTPIDTTSAINNFRSAFERNNDLNYAAAYYPNLKTTIDYKYEPENVEVIITNTTGDTETNEDPVSLEFLINPPMASPIIPPQTAIYNLAIASIRNQLSPTLPPSPAIAGIYAKVDGSRGVWKAPANVSIAAVYDLTAKISEAEQGEMNIDPTSGKSVNAIRHFQGKGFLVWGARTLAGNDNEWRYINVRRFFIMVEESSKKATMQFVFEPNDANTWVKLRAKLENYLTLLWRQGALAGAKPEHAFYVRCGLGFTMTAQDILEGRLIVEIGMAAVRPAEFIILRFSHIMQES